MNLEIKKDLTSNWFKTLQESFCDDIIKFEKNKTKFKSTNWKRNTKARRVHFFNFRFASITLRVH